jgi:hypothetical protein
VNIRAYIWDMNNAQNTATMTASIQLQHIGRVQATPAGNLKEGMRLMWNFGEMSDVVSIDRETAKSIWITEKCDRTGKLFSRRFAKTRLVAAF